MAASPNDIWPRQQFFRISIEQKVHHHERHDVFAGPGDVGTADEVMKFFPKAAFDQCHLGDAQARPEMLKGLAGAKLHRCAAIRRDRGAGEVGVIKQMNAAGQARIAFDGIRVAVIFDEHVERNKAAVAGGLDKPCGPGFDRCAVGGALERNRDAAGKDRAFVNSGAEALAVSGQRKAT